MNCKTSVVCYQHRETLLVMSIPEKALTACTESRSGRARGVLCTNSQLQKRRFARGRANRKFECPRGWRELSVELRMTKPAPGNTRRLPVRDPGYSAVPLSRMQHAPNS